MIISTLIAARKRRAAARKRLRRREEKADKFKKALARELRNHRPAPRDPNAPPQWIKIEASMAFITDVTGHIPDSVLEKLRISRKEAFKLLLTTRHTPVATLRQKYHLVAKPSRSAGHVWVISEKPLQQKRVAQKAKKIGKATRQRIPQRAR